jgi:hypothetical protein
MSRLGVDTNDVARFRDKPSDHGSAYAEIHWDGSSSRHALGGGGGGGWDNYHSQHARQGPPSGSASVEHNTRYDTDHDIQKCNKSVGGREAETFRRDSMMHKLSHSGGATLHGMDDANDDSHSDDVIFNRTDMKATIGVCAAATLGGERYF